MTFSPNLDQMTPEQLRALAAQALQLQSQVEAMSKKIQNDEILIEQFKFEIALLKRHKFAKRSEQISPAQGSLLDDLLDTDLEAIEAELKQLLPTAPQAQPRQSPKRVPLPPQFSRTVIRHEPENTQCACGCQLQRIGEDVSEKLDYTPGVFTVEQHVRGKWACRQCETLIQAPVPAQVIDKGIPTAGLLAHVMVAKFADHLPLYRQEKIFGRAGLAIARSTLAQWVGQTGVRLHARRKFFDLHVANKSQLAEQALHSISGLYEVERQARDMSDEDRWRIRQEMAVPIIKTLHDWMLAQRDLVPNGSASGPTCCLLIWCWRMTRTITVPAGFATDFASIKVMHNAFLFVLFALVAGYGNYAPTVHDWLNRTGQMARKEADAVLHRALRAEGVAHWRAWLMWAGVRLGGGKHYTAPTRSGSSSPGAWNDEAPVVRNHRGLYFLQRPSSHGERDRNVNSLTAAWRYFFVWRRPMRTS